MKTEQEIAEQIAIDADMYCEEFGWQRIDLEIACYEMARQIQRWIPVEEELPVFDNAKYPNGDYEVYFVKISTGGMNPVIKYGVAHLINKSKWSCESDWNVVTHYRPIKYK